MTQERKNLGSWGEEEAIRFLKKKGYKILARNYKTKLGEIDAVASKSGAIIFVEVKTRIKQCLEVEPPNIENIDNATFLPEDNIDWKKQQKLVKLGEHYLLTNNYPDDQEWQIDVIAVETGLDGAILALRHWDNAVAEL